MSPDRLLRRINGPRGSALLCIAGLGAVHAVVNASLSGHSPLPSGLDQIDAVVPLVVYAVLWTVATVPAVVAALTDRRGRQRDEWDAWGFALVPGLLVVWSLTYLAGWVTHGDDDLLVYGLIYLLVAGLALTAARMTNPGSATRRPRAWTSPTSSQP